MQFTTEDVRVAGYAHMVDQAVQRRMLDSNHRWTADEFIQEDVLDGVTLFSGQKCTLTNYRL